MITAAAIERRNALLQVGGWSRRLGLAAVLAAADPRTGPDFSSAGGLRPVLPRDSIIPAALPRCLVFLRRRVWGISPRTLVRSAAGVGLDRSRESGPPAGSSRTRPSGPVRQARRARSWRAATPPRRACKGASGPGARR